MKTETIDKALDEVLRAAGTGMRYYSMQKTIDDMRSAMRRALASDPVRAELLAALRETICLVRPESQDGMSVDRARAAIDKALVD